MPRLHLLSFLVLIIAVGAARPARAQDGADSLADQLQNKFDPNEAEHAKQKAEQEKAQKKQEKASTKREQENPQNARTEQSQENAKPEVARQESARTQKPQPKPKPKPTKAPAKQTTASNAQHKHWWSMPHLHRKHSDDSAVSKAQPKSNKKTAAAKPHGKTVPAAAHSSKPVGQNCSASEEKKGNCKPEQKQSARATTRQS